MLLRRFLISEDFFYLKLELQQNRINIQNVSSEATKLLRLMLKSNQMNTIEHGTWTIWRFFFLFSSPNPTNNRNKDWQRCKLFQLITVVLFDDFYNTRDTMTAAPDDRRNLLIISTIPEVIVIMSWVPLTQSNLAKKIM